MRRPKHDPALADRYEIVAVDELADLRAIARSVEAKPPKDDPKQPDPRVPIRWFPLVLVTIHLPLVLGVYLTT